MLSKILDFLTHEYVIGDTITISILGALMVIGVFLLTSFILKIINRIASSKLNKDSRLKFKSVFSFFNNFIYAVVFLLTLQNFGVNITAIFAASAALLVGIGLALQTFFQDIISGIFILSDQTVHVGDVIEINGKVCKVKNIKLRTTRATTIDNKVLIIPNHIYLTSILYNWTANGALTRESIVVGVSYDSDPDKVKELLIAVANDHPKVLKNPAPIVMLSEFGDSSLEFTLLFSMNSSFESNLSKSDIRFSIVSSFREHNIEIPFPQRVVHMQNN
ncbi:MAG: mechanosensitive ion channel [Flavobacteriaceae bacterium]|jgi:small-conductance mechanosensitive channel|nr:mechanosensitive ion channel [Flavobacteriaceae bacterium]MDG2314806.1 mechanosensitive ion channel [Flavobacteriaceae bacterium]